MSQRRNNRLWCRAPGVLVLVLVGCGEVDSSQTSSTGSSGEFSAAAGGVVAAAGGTAATGGSSPTGGSAGSTPSGGESSAGVPNGGTVTDGGASSAGASGGMTAAGAGGDDSASEVTQSWTFDSGLEAWQVRSTAPSRLEGIVALVWSGDDGKPRPGMLQLIAPFDSGGESVRVGVELSAPVDLTGKTLVANIKVIYGLAADLSVTPGSARIYVRSGVANVYADNGGQNLDAAGMWSAFRLNASTPTFVDTTAGSYDATDIREIGIEIDTNATATAATTAVLAIDSVAY